MMEDIQYEHAKRIASLILKYNDRELSDTEFDELMDWIEANEGNRQLLEQLSNAKNIGDKLKELLSERKKQAGWESVMAAIGEEGQMSGVPPMTRVGLLRSLAAVTVGVILVVGAWVFLRSRSNDGSPQVISSVTTNDIDPGGNKAMLTLANGRQIALDDVKAGALTQEGATGVVKKDAATLSYTVADVNGRSEDEPLLYNTLSTPRAGMFVVELSDHSKVWLNSQSSLKYPTSFKGQSKRLVELNGEAFFDIAKDADHPFNVKVKDRVIEVLGTSFNIQSYEDEQSMQTTLVSGAVRVIAGGKSRILNPGQQAAISNDADGDKEIALKKLDNLGQVTAWKDGLFFFHDNDIETVMRQLARWYDVEIVYEGKKTTDRFSGMIRRDKRASDVLKVLALSDVHFRIEGKKIIVML